jgi:hypothetical protein
VLEAPRERSQDPGAAQALSWRDAVRELHGRGAAALGVREDVQARERAGGEQVDGALEGLGGLAGEAGDDVSAEVDAGTAATRVGRRSRRSATRVTATHGPQNLVVAALDREVEVTSEAAVAGQQGDQAGVDLVGVDRAEAQAAGAELGQQPVEQTDRGRARLRSRP